MLSDAVHQPCDKVIGVVGEDNDDNLQLKTVNQSVAEESNVIITSVNTQLVCNANMWIKESACRSFPLAHGSAMNNFSSNLALGKNASV